MTKTNTISSRSRLYALIVLVLIGLVVVSSVPLVSSSYEVVEKVQTTIPQVGATSTVTIRTVLEPKIVTSTSTYFAKTTTTRTQQVIEHRNQNLFSFNDFTLQSNYHKPSEQYLQAGRQVQASFKASGDISAYLFTKSEYEKWKSGDTANSLASIEGEKEGTIGYITPLSTTYVFVVVNRAGFFGLLGADIGVYEFKASASWDETVSRPELVEAIVEKTQTTTQTTTLTQTTRVTEVITTTTTITTTSEQLSTRTKTITLLQYLLGSGND